MLNHYRHDLQPTQIKIELYKMKNLKIIGMLLLFMTIAKSAEAKRYEINRYITSDDGCEWHITGYVDISTSFGWPPISINGYDITMEGPCGRHHFSGGSKITNDGIAFFDPKLTNLETGQIIDLQEFPQLSQIMNQLELQYGTL